ncbi:acyl-CoA thioesterase [Colwellia sp. 6M3]|jgi:acyl-CoA thioester hydrolase|uniref:acyl-CoA thioesterase n=1 Tax=Colwellia sp. 6M3 TaxID=2759849 RepID=UPI0015F53DBF|nr:acyl-CoA thioesterase [Colwellia sp. 6M3]MBA6417234.1 acyl-CoA thioesterase [Colwellia sp. 6M3]|tara:strand:- start:1792 stop:2229 length:438 start_codon:yes stop_codon:yes gene_type:complete
MKDQLHCYSHQLKHPVRWGDIDMLGHVNNSNYFRYCEEGRVKFFSDSHIRAALGGDKLGFVVAYIDCKFKFPVTYPDNLIIATKVEKISTDRFTLSQVIYSETHQKIAAKSESIIVSYSHEMQSKISLSNAALSLLEKELNRQFE